MKNYGIELEFFVVNPLNSNALVPAFEATSNLDGNLGMRVEYRSLPNTIDLDILLETLIKL